MSGASKSVVTSIAGSGGAGAAPASSSGAANGTSGSSTGGGGGGGLSGGTTIRSVSSFEKLNRIGEGTYGTVYRARDRDSGEIVALKRLRLQKEKSGFPLTSIREIKILKSVQHPNIVALREVTVGKKHDSIFLVFEYCEHDFASILDRGKHLITAVPPPLPPAGGATASSTSAASAAPSSSGGYMSSLSDIKTVVLQLLRAVSYLHSNFIIHRDLKLSNLLVNARGQLKLADFGLAREFGNPLKPYTPRVVTLWYRAPEILLGADTYHTAIDMWAVGCIMGELFLHRPLLPGKTDPHQLNLIVDLLGTPNAKLWPALTKLLTALPLGITLKQNPYSRLADEMSRTPPGTTYQLSANGLDLLGRFLTYDPSKRISAERALQHSWFTEYPLPTPEHRMPTFGTLAHVHAAAAAAAAAAASSAAASIAGTERLSTATTTNGGGAAPTPTLDSGAGSAANSRAAKKLKIQLSAPAATASAAGDAKSSSASSPVFVPPQPRPARVIQLPPVSTLPAASASVSVSSTNSPPPPIRYGPAPPPAAASTAAGAEDLSEDESEPSAGAAAIGGATGGVDDDSTDTQLLSQPDGSSHAAAAAPAAVTVDGDSDGDGDGASTAAVGSGSKKRKHTPPDAADAGSDE